MAFQEVTGGTSIDIKTSQGKPYTGKYTGCRKFQTKMGEQVAYNFEGADGNFSIYGFSHLNYLMNSVKEGDLVRITYLGREKAQTKYGEKEVHKAKLEIDYDHRKSVDTVKEAFDDPLSE